MQIPPSGVVEFMAREDSSDLALLRVPAGTARAVEKFWQERGDPPGSERRGVGMSASRPPRLGSEREHRRRQRDRRHRVNALARVLLRWRCGLGG